jgi:hypothetical protein
MSMLVLAGIAIMGSGCPFTVTKDRPSYESLDAKEKEAIDAILQELAALNGQIKRRTIYNIDEVVDKAHIDVSYNGMIFTTNIGDDVIHVSTWENLSGKEQSLIQGWHKAGTLAEAEQTYKTFFYHFLAVVQGVKQFMYKVLTPAWVFTHRSLFNIEKDSIRTTMAYYVAESRQGQMWGFLTSACQPIKEQLGGTYGPHYDKKYLTEHLTELANPENPSGYMYFVCRWIDEGQSDAEDLTIELNWLRDLPLP